MSTNQVVMLHIALSVSRVGSVTYYVPVLVAEDEDSKHEEQPEEEQQEHREDGAGAD